MHAPDDVVLLLVDDQPIVGEAIRRAVADQPNVRFHYCSNGARAIETAERIKPTVILQDLVMPGIDGLALVIAYRRNEATKNIPIIVLSTKEEPAIKSQSFASGASDYLVKLPDNVELIARIRHHSRAFIIQMQRDEAYRALRESQLLLVEKNLELERMSSVDGLTGLSNRRYFNEYSLIQWKQALREQSAYSILMIDVDDFKRYNDTYGHLAGDRVLIDVGAAMKGTLRRPTDLVARFGGEEFIASLSTQFEGAALVAETLREAVEAAAIEHGGSSASKVVTVSVGGASTVPRLGESLAELIEAADLALYEAKRAGKNRIVVRHKAGPLRAVSG